MLRYRSSTFPIIRYTPPVRIRLFLIGALLLAAPVAAFAEQVMLTPSLELDQASIARRLSSPKTQTMQVRGAGAKLKIAYSSSLPIDIDLAPMVAGSSFDPADLGHTTLPAGKDMVAMIDLTVAPSWKPWGSTYYVAFFVHAEKIDAEMQEITVVPGGLGSVIGAAVHHLLEPEEYQVATPHALRGHRIIGVSLTLIVGLATLIALAYLLIRKREVRSMVLAGFIGLLFYSFWFGLDILRFTTGHVSAWEKDHTYAQAGSIYEVADELKAEDARGHAVKGVYVCTTSTDYMTKVLRYLLFPVHVSIAAEDVNSSTHMLITGIGDWTYTEGKLHCGRIDGPATKVREFADGSVLFSVYRQ